MFDPTYTVEDGGKQLGPFSREVITTLWQQKRISAGARVSLAGVDDWTPLSRWFVRPDATRPVRSEESAKAQQSAEPSISKTGAMLVKPQRSRGLYIMFALFFGCFGVHNFYAGHILRAVCQAAMTLIGGGFATQVPPVGIVFWATAALWALVDAMIETVDGDGDRLA